LRREPIEKRKALLANLLKGQQTSIVLNEYFEEDGATVFREACKLGCEGIVSKRLGSLYRSGRSPHWVKVKNPKAPAVKREAEEDWGREVLARLLLRPRFCKPEGQSARPRFHICQLPVVAEVGDDARQDDRSWASKSGPKPGRRGISMTWPRNWTWGCPSKRGISRQPCKNTPLRNQLASRLALESSPAQRTASP
jgi:hypothetical protein